MESFQAWFVVKDPQTRRPSNPEVATKHLARPKQLFFKHRANCSRNVIRQEPSGHGITKQIHSPLLKVSAASALSVERTPLGHPPAQVRCGLPWLSAF
jgi:hypothetical protein